MTSTLLARLLCPRKLPKLLHCQTFLSRARHSRLALDQIVRRSLLIDWYIGAVRDG